MGSCNMRHVCLVDVYTSAWRPVSSTILSLRFTRIMLCSTTWFPSMKPFPVVNNDLPLLEMR